ncbi:PREDICTED: uncharacterized protein LOC106818548 [Priapulus caudatus]|uniref:Uncharacterized protein LOC106818548 n=1 Tax=Priapulus caudatus TaxID=37621 RepID=A0ABM1F2R3_PRICU|nr:PREDICTED: uncharacterized protein LOC106818548 [Priapulus caudatus]
MIDYAVTVWGTAAAPSIKLRLHEGTSISNKAKQATYVDLGQDLLLVASLDDIGLYTNFILYNCVASAPDSQYSMVLIDNHECVNSDLYPELIKSEGVAKSRGASVEKYVKFAAFRFASGDRVQFQCDVIPCTADYDCDDVVFGRCAMLNE